MNSNLLIHTISNLKLKQLFYQLKLKLKKETYQHLHYSGGYKHLKLKSFIVKKNHCLEDTFSFLNITTPFISWNYVENGMLWAYNLNYMDWLNQGNVTFEGGAIWINKFIEDLLSNRIGLDSYPISLRGINWIKFISFHYDEVNEHLLKKWNDSLYSQYKLLEKKLEYHLLGNHLLENAYSLYIAAIYFEDKKMYERASQLLISELNEQTLADGAHYEQSPMYHCILLDRLLDCINFGTTEELKSIAQKQLGWLQAICYKDGSWPMFNDAALGIAPDTDRIFDYAKRLGLSWTTAKLGVSGYRKMQGGNIEAVIDCGQITATYQPGHSHADTFNYELRMNGKPFVVDTGISTYDKTARRQYERSTEAHNCVVVDGKSSSEVWGGFRVGRRCKVTILKDYPHCIEAYHNGFKKKCYRTFTMSDNTFIVEDRYDGYAVSLIHLAPDADMNKIKIEGADKIEIHETKYSVEYNRFIPNKTIAIHFNGKMSYRISC